MSGFRNAWASSITISEYSFGIRGQRALGDLLERPHFDPELESLLEARPGTIPEGRGGDEQRPLPVALDHIGEQLAGDERLAESNAVRDQGAVVAREDTPGAGQAVGLEPGELNPARFPDLLLQFLAVSFPQDPEIQQVRGVLLVPRLVDRAQVVGDRLFPQRVEPLADGGDHVWLVVPEIELQIRREARGGEVRRAGNHALAVGEHESLAVQELLLIAADFDLARREELEQAPHSPIHTPRERQEVAVVT